MNTSKIQHESARRVVLELLQQCWESTCLPLNNRAPAKQRFPRKKSRIRERSSRHNFSLWTQNTKEKKGRNAIFYLLYCFLSFHSKASHMLCFCFLLICCWPNQWSSSLVTRTKSYFKPPKHIWTILISLLKWKARTTALFTFTNVEGGVGENLSGARIAKADILWT